MANCNYHNSCNTINSVYSCSLNYTPNKNNLNKLEKDICYICQNQYDYFLNKPHVVGLGLGFKDIGGYMTSIDSIIVYVNKKVELKDLSSSDIIPSLYNHIPTDVVQIGGFFKSLKAPNDRIRPVMGGFSISPQLVDYCGTSGCLVNDSNGLYILSNNHILANFNKLQIGTPITQPSTIEGGKTPNDIIAFLHRFIPLQFTTIFKRPKNYVDCAIAKVNNPSLVSPNIAIIGRPPQGITPPTLNIGVKKVGRTSGLTSGIVRSINTTIMGDCNVLYVDQIISTLISKVGDSGALVLDSYDKAFGLLIGGTNENYAIINPILKVLELLKVSLVISNNA